MKVILFLMAMAAAGWAQETDDDSTPLDFIPSDSVAHQSVAAPLPVAAPDSLSASVPDSMAIPALSDSAQPVVQKKRSSRKDKRVSVDKAVETIATYQGNVNQLKSPKKAFFMSFIYPGVGQYYARAGWARIGLPVVVELASYVSIFIVRGKYNDLVTKYEKYADRHFNPQKLIAWQEFVLYDTSYIHWKLDGDTMPFSHREDFIKNYNQKTPDYYEVVGKYDEFVQGWDDVDPNMVNPSTAYPDSFGYIKDYQSKFPSQLRGLAIDTFTNNSDGTIKDTTFLRYHDPGTNHRPFYYGHSQHQLDYVSLRNDANDMADFTLLAFYAMLLNRMVSAVDAVFAATAYNRRITGEKLSFIDHIHVEPQHRPTFPHFTNGVSVAYRF